MNAFSESFESEAAVFEIYKNGFEQERNKPVCTSVGKKQPKTKNK